VDVDELRVLATTWKRAYDQAAMKFRFYGTDSRADLDLRQAAGELIGLIRECGPGVRGVVLEGRLYLDSTDPLVEAIAASFGAVPWHVTRIRLSRPNFHLVDPWHIVGTDPLP
jgi:hypothetical protein